MNALTSLFSVPAQYAVLLPEIFLCLVGVLALVLAATRWRSSPVGLYTILWAQVAVFVFSVFHALALPRTGSVELLGGQLQTGLGLQLASLALQAIGIAVAWMSKRQAQKHQRLGLEYYGLLTAATLSLMFFVKSANFVTFFLTLEASSLFVALLLMLGSPRQASSARNALKYLIQSGLSGVIVLWGLVLLYIQTGSFHYDAVAHALATPDGLWGKLGVGLVLSGLLFKLGLFPFTFYLPEIYQHASRPVLAFVATASKLAAAVALVCLMSQPFRAQVDVVAPFLTDIVLISLLWGSFSALHQVNVHRLLALSGVVHAAFITSGILLAHSVPAALPAVFFYFLVYVPAVLLLMYCLTELNPSDMTFEGLRNAHQRFPAFAVLMALALGSMAGLPPLGGFIAKFIVFFNTLTAGQWVLLTAMVISSILGLYYYLSFIFGFMGRHSAPGGTVPPIPERTPASTLVIVTLCACMIVVLGLFQGHLGALFR